VTENETGHAPVGGRLSVARLEAFRRLTLETALAEVALKFSTLGISFLVLKGPAFARWLYDDPRERPYGDLDLLVRGTQMADAGRGLGALGFALAAPHNTTDIERSCYHVLWIRPGELPAEIELHYTLGFVPVDPAIVWRRFTERTDVIEVAGARVATPSPAVSAFQVALHAAFHEFSNWPTPRGGAQPPVRDLRRALDRVEIDVWREAAVIADELGAAAAFANGLRLDPRGAALADRLEQRIGT
jgi:hypothetical protein